MEWSYTMVLSVLLTLSMTIAAIAWVVSPLLRGAEAGRQGADGGDIQSSAALAVLREQRRDLERDKAAGLIEAAAFDQAMQELEQRALSEGLQQRQTQDRAAQPRWAWGVMAWLVLVPLVGYLALGDPAAVEPANRQAAVDTNNADALSEMVGNLAQRLEGGGGTPSEWAMLARSYTVLENYAGAAYAYEQLLTLIGPDDPNAAAVREVLEDMRQAMRQGTAE